MTCHAKYLARAQIWVLQKYVMNRFCIDRGNLLGNPGIRTIEQPDMHSYHCLLDVGICNGSGFEILLDPTNPGDLYTRAVRLDDDDTGTLVDLGRSFGSKEDGCSTCTGEGSETTGFRVTVKGTLQDLGSTNEPPLFQSDEVDGLAQGCADDVTDISDMMDELTFPGSTSTENDPISPCRLVSFKRLVDIFVDFQ